MNKKQKICLWIGITVIVLMGFYPPIERTRTYPVRNLSTRAPTFSTKYVEYGFILDDPGHIVLGNLIVQWVVVSAITGGLIYTFKDKKLKDE